MKIRYDAEVDALYIELRTLEPGTADCRELTPDITADYAPDGKLAGLEILEASRLLGDEVNKVVLNGARFLAGHGLIGELVVFATNLQPYYRERAGPSRPLLR